MIRITSILFFFVISSLSFSQNLRLITSLSSYLNENSGLITVTNNSFWTHNDSGDGPIIYNIDSNGNQLDSIYLNGATNIDFEDITQDNLGNYYIGDIGNNSHNRTNLRIYKIPNPATITGNNVTPEIINYSYQDQIAFPDPNQNSDCEALFHHGSNLYLISKNWGTSGYSKLYQLPDTAGTHIAMLLDSFPSGLITGADIHSSGKLAILSMDRVYICDNYTGNDFLGGTISTLLFPLSQKEGISFKDVNSVYISQEHHSLFPGAKLYELNLSGFAGNIEIERFPDMQAMPNPTSKGLKISIKNLIIDPNIVSYQIIDLQGKVVKQNSFSFHPEFSVFLFELKAGYYIIKVTAGNQQFSKPFIKN
ncbi:T9SS type A sorting domain-containing protein [Flavobacteriales bacterium]|nr:T9SS type A sorting domain-containing protein [Flavobacteriales bacterium]